MRPYATVLLLVGSILVLGGCASRQVPAPATVTVTAAAPAAPTSAAGDLASTFTMTGTFDIFTDPASTGGLKDGQPCQTSAPDGSPVGSSTVVHVFTGQGTQLAWGYLSQGHFVAQVNACVYPISVEDVPDGLPGYGVEVSQFGVKQINSTEAHGTVFLTEGP